MSTNFLHVNQSSNHDCSIKNTRYISILRSQTEKKIVIWREKFRLNEAYIETRIHMIQYHSKLADQKKKCDTKYFDCKTQFQSSSNTEISLNVVLHV